MLNRYHHRWTAAEIAVLRERYPNVATKDLAEQLGIPMARVYAKANSMGLHKSDAFLATSASGRILRGGKLSQATQFKPGQQSWNKGTKGTTGLHENCRRHQFKPGRPPEENRNYLPIGSVRESRYGYLERKVTDDRSLVPARRWVAIHRLVWEEAHGPIPKTHMVVYRPGMRTMVEAEITVDRLECISKGENARRNHPRSHSPELARLIQLKGAITRQVNRISREAEEASA